MLPVLVLVAIAIPSFKLLYGQYDPSKLYADFDPDTAQFLTLKFTGVQWAWDVSYPNDEENAALGRGRADLASTCCRSRTTRSREGQIRNLSVDNPVVVPVDTFVRVQVTAEGDAIHAFAMPAFGLKEDAVPGRLNETYFKAEREGIFYGQCSELCGKDHAFMPLDDPRRLGGPVPRLGGAGRVRPAAAYQTLAADRRDDKSKNERLAAR